MAVVAYVFTEGEDYVAYRAGTAVGQIILEKGVWFAWAYTNQAHKAFRRLFPAKQWLEGQVKDPNRGEVNAYEGNPCNRVPHGRGMEGA